MIRKNWKLMLGAVIIGVSAGTIDHIYHPSMEYGWFFAVAMALGCAIAGVGIYIEENDIKLSSILSKKRG